MEVGVQVIALLTQSTHGMLILGGSGHTYLAIRGIAVLWDTCFGVGTWLESKSTFLTFKTVNLSLGIHEIFTFKAPLNAGAVKGG